MDIIERRMDQLTSSFEKFMHRMESRAQVPERQNTRQERTTEQNESTPEVKGLGNVSVFINMIVTRYYRISIDAEKKVHILKRDQFQGIRRIIEIRQTTETLITLEKHLTFEIV